MIWTSQSLWFQPSLLLRLQFSWMLIKAMREEFPPCSPSNVLSLSLVPVCSGFPWLGAGVPSWLLSEVLPSVRHVTIQSFHSWNDPSPRSTIFVLCLTFFLKICCNILYLNKSSLLINWYIFLMEKKSLVTRVGSLWFLTSIFLEPAEGKVWCLPIATSAIAVLWWFACGFTLFNFAAFGTGVTLIFLVLMPRNHCPCSVLILLAVVSDCLTRTPSS